MKEVVFYFFQLENANELEIASPNDLYSYSTCVSPSIPEEWTTKGDTNLLQTSKRIDRAINAAVGTLKEMKWELVTRAIHMGRTSNDLEDTYMSRYKELREKDEDSATSSCKVSPEPFSSTSMPSYERAQTPSKCNISPLIDSLMSSYTKIKKRSKVNDHIRKNWQEQFTLIEFSSQATARLLKRNASSLIPRQSQSPLHMHETLAPSLHIPHLRPTQPC